MVIQVQPYLDRPVIIPNIVDFDSWLLSFKERWKQGEHVELCGATGTGKTTVAHNILDARDYVTVLAAKRFDDTLQRFKTGHLFGRGRYSVIRKWPPEFNQRRVIYWQKPTKLEDQKKVTDAFHNALNEMYRSGGWCIYTDDAGYLAGTLGLAKDYGVLLNQGRSAGISMVNSLQRPHSMVQKIPVETLSQCRHHLIFKYTDEREIKSCAEICGLSYKEMLRLQYNLKIDSNKGFSDFICVSHGSVEIVRNVKG